MQPHDTATTILELETPFAGVAEPFAPQRDATPEYEGFASMSELESPFVGEYWTTEGESEVASPATAELVDLLEQLWDAEFDELTEQLADEAARTVDARLPESEVAGDPAVRERFVEAWLEPLRQHAEGIFETIADRVSEVDPMTLGEAELDALLAPIEVGETDLSPLFEDFLGGLLKKAKKLAKGAVKLAKKGIAAVGRLLPINILLRKLKALVQPLLQRVLRYAIGKLPADLRPAATQLARRLLGTAGLEGTKAAEPAAAATPAADPPAAAEPAQAPATADGAAVQQEFDLAAASLLFAADETESEIALAEAMLVAQEDVGDDVAALDRARRRFVAELSQLADHEDPAPAIQNFLPAIMPVAKMAVGLVGRDRIIRFLAPYLAKLIERYTGPQSSAPLARAIADAGLRIIGLEVPADEATGEDAREASAAALAATVEDTVHRIAELHELELEDEGALAHQAYAAFEAAAIANMPPAILAPELRPTAGLDGTWVPLAGARAKKYSVVLDATLPPQVARHLTTFGGASLAEATADGEGEVQAHLYEALPGTTLAGLAAAERADVADFHPLSAEAASLLFREPGLGRNAAAAYTADRSHVAVGQRLTHTGAAAGRRPRGGRPTAVRATIDVRAARRTIGLRLFLAEADAQRIVALVNRGADTAAVVAALREITGALLRGALSGRVQRRVRVVVDNGIPRPRPRWLHRLNALLPTFAASVEGWCFKPLAAHEGLAQQLATAAASEHDGVVIAVRLEHIAGLDDAGAAVKLAGAPARPAAPQLGAPERSTVRIFPGRRA